MMWSSARRRVIFALLWLLGGCGGPASPAEEPTVPPAPLAPPPTQDQQFLLDPVDLGAIAPSELRPPSASGLLHQAEELRQVALADASASRACQSESGEGRVVLSLEIDRQGRVLGAATTPAGGEEGWAAVADCILARARSWKFPERTRPGHTRITLPIDFPAPVAAGDR